MHIWALLIRPPARLSLRQWPGPGTGSRTRTTEPRRSSTLTVFSPGAACGPGHGRTPSLISAATVGAATTEELMQLLTTFASTAERFLQRRWPRSPRAASQCALRAPSVPRATRPALRVLRALIATGPRPRSVQAARRAPRSSRPRPVARHPRRL